jgi:hypothetical protein
MAPIGQYDYLKYIAVGMSLGVIGSAVIPKIFAVSTLTDPTLFFTLLGGTFSAFYDPVNQKNLMLGF